METIIGYIVFGIFILISFSLGLYYGFKLKNEEPINAPKIPNPIKALQEHKEVKEMKKQLEKDQEIMNINLENIENYNGSEIGQKEFPE